MRTISLHMLIALLGLGLTVTGCNLITGSDESDSGPAEDLPEAPSGLYQQFGGYEPTDENPGFGDPTILNEFSNAREVLVDDPVGHDPDVIEMENLPETDAYILRITWGRLEEEGSSHLDWSGSASVVNGAILVRKAILFDPGDYIHRPREDRRTLSWTSNTSTHIDGLSLRIIDPTSIPAGEDAVMNQFSFETGPFSSTFALEDLAEIDTLITVDEEGNAIHFSGFKREPNPCRAGFIRGRWFRQGQDWGEFRGGWISDEDGELKGHIRGIWGNDQDGRNVLFGKYVDVDGNFMGLLRGTFDVAPRGLSDARGASGRFRGHWYDADQEVQGVFRGRWKESRTRGDGGYMRGVWGHDCPELTAEVPSQ